jgi:hypothetical protein
MSHTSDKKRAAAKITEDGDEERKPSSNKKISRRDDDDAMSRRRSTADPFLLALATPFHPKMTCCEEVCDLFGYRRIPRGLCF